MNILQIKLCLFEFQRKPEKDQQKTNLFSEEYKLSASKVKRSLGFFSFLPSFLSFPSFEFSFSTLLTLTFFVKITFLFLLKSSFVQEAKRDHEIAKINFKEKCLHRPFQINSHLFADICIETCSIVQSTLLYMLYSSLFRFLLLFAFVRTISTDHNWLFYVELYYLQLFTIISYHLHAHIMLLRYVICNYIRHMEVWIIIYKHEA